jgi:hypothetical protein
LKRPIFSIFVLYYLRKMFSVKHISLILAAATIMVSCAKMELEDHCPEEEQNAGPTWNPGDVKSNDGSLKGEYKTQGPLHLDATSGTDSGNSSSSVKDDEFVNDDSDNEDEDQSSRTPGSDSSGSKK